MWDRELNKGLELLLKAEKEEGNFEEALGLYENAVKHFNNAVDYEAQYEKLKREKFGEFLERARAIRKLLKASKGNSKARPVIDQDEGVSASKKRKSEESVKISGTGDTERKKLQSQLGGAIVVETPNIKWSDVVGLERAKEGLDEAVIIPTKFSDIFTGRRTPWKGVLLYGPSGTGKSLLAKAVATRASNSTFFTIFSSALVSGMFGESEKRVKNLFDLARQHKPSIIFIDKIDFLCSSSYENLSENARRIRAEFFVQMQGLKANYEGILVLGATNIPWALDPAIRRLFEIRIYIPLPDIPARANMFKANLKNSSHSCTLTEQDFEELSRRTDGYSGVDIQMVVHDAAMRSMLKVRKATHFRFVRGPSRSDPDSMVNDLLTPSSTDFPGAIEMTWTDVPGDKLLQPPVTMSDMLKSLTTYKPRVKDADLKKMDEFASEFGQRG